MKVRAEAMQIASEMHQGGMATVFYGPDSNLNKALKRAKEWAIERGVEKPECEIANYLFPHCKTVAGSEEVSTPNPYIHSYKNRKVAAFTSTTATLVSKWYNL